MTPSIRWSTTPPTPSKSKSDPQGERPSCYPTWRPDKSIFLYDLTFWNEWVGKLEAASGVTVKSYATFLDALKKRHDAFHAAGCRASDHGLETCTPPPTPNGRSR